MSRVEVDKEKLNKLIKDHSNKSCNDCIADKYCHEIGVRCSSCENIILSYLKEVN